MDSLTAGTGDGVVVVAVAVFVRMEESMGVEVLVAGSKEVEEEVGRGVAVLSSRQVYKRGSAQGKGSCTGLRRKTYAQLDLPVTVCDKLPRLNVSALKRPGTSVWVSARAPGGDAHACPRASHATQKLRRLCGRRTGHHSRFR